MVLKVDLVFHNISVFYLKCTTTADFWISDMLRPALYLRPILHEIGED